MSSRSSRYGYGLLFWWSVPLAVLFWSALFVVLGVVMGAPKPPPAPVTVTEQLVTLPPTPGPRVAPASPPKPAPRPKPARKPPAQKRPAVKPRPVARAKPETRPETKPTVKNAQTPLPAATPAAPDKRISGGQAAARALYHPLPVIPDALRMAVVDVVAVARFAIAEDGSAEVTLVQASPDPRINQIILRTLRTWRFFPAMKNGQPQSSVQDLRIQLRVQ